MARRRRASDPRQLELPCNLEDRADPQQLIAWLQEEYVTQQAEIQDLTTQLSAAQHLFETMRRTKDATIHKLHTEVFMLHAQLRLTLPDASAPLPDWLSGELRRLLAVAHPDKWSAGQDAQALAHEVAATINTLRQRLGEA